MSEDRPSDHEVRDILVGDYQAYARSRGTNPSTRDLEALAAADMAITEKVEAEAKAAPPRAPAEPAPPRTEPVAAAVLAANRGGRYEKRAIPTDEPNPENETPVPLVARNGGKDLALVARYRLMMELDPTGNLKSPSAADLPFKYPALAKACATEFIDHKLGRRKYRGLSAIDGRAAFRRAIEDIADRSTGQLGPWWVK